MNSNSPNSDELNEAILTACAVSISLGASSAREAAEMTAGRKLTDAEWGEFGSGWLKHWEAANSPCNQSLSNVDLGHLGAYFSIERQVDVLARFKDWLSWSIDNQRDLNDALASLAANHGLTETWGTQLDRLKHNQQLQKKAVDDFVSCSSEAANSNRQALAWAFRLLAVNTAALRKMGTNAIFSETKKFLEPNFDFDGLQFEDLTEAPKALSKPSHDQSIETSREARLREVKFLESERLITPEEAEIKRKSILEEI
jgi:hypothetical protein